jgi:hypothetical protein
LTIPDWREVEMEKQKVKTYFKDGIEYTASNNRMRFNPEYHFNHGKRFTNEDLRYICSMWGSMPIQDIALAVGKTYSTVAAKVNTLKNIGLFEHYRKMGKTQQED